MSWSRIFRIAVNTLRRGGFNGYADCGHEKVRRGKREGGDRAEANCVDSRSGFGPVRCDHGLDYLEVG